MKKEPEFKKCKFAGDPEDEFCAKCDGLYPVNDDGQPQPASTCGGYEPEEEKPEETAVEQPAAQDTPEQEYAVAGETTVIRAEYGVSCEVNGAWHKFTFSEERVLPTGCDLNKEKQALWDDVIQEIDNQLDSVRN